MKRVTVVLPVDVHKALKFKSIHDDKTMNDLILTAVQQYLMNSGSEKNASK